MNVVLMVASLSALVSAAAPSPTAAPPERPLSLELATEGSAVAVLGGTWLTLDLLGPRLARTSCPCDRGEVNAFDRFAIDRAWPHGAPIANAVLGATLVGATVGSLTLAHGARERWRNVLMLAESVTLTGALGQGVKLGVSRPYPYMYRSSADAFQQQSGINYESFWSGHAAVAMAAVTTLLMEASLAHASPALVWVLRVVGPVIALSAGVLELSSGFHFPTDVLAGGLAGASVGVGNVLLHEAWHF